MPTKHCRHCNISICFLKQQTWKVRLQDGCPFSSLALAPFLPFLRAHLFAEGEPLLANRAACACSEAVGAGGVTQAVVTPRHCPCSPAVVLFSRWSPHSMMVSASYQLFRDPPREGGSPNQPEEMKDTCQLEQGGFAGEHHGFHIYFAELVTLSCICHSSF